MNFHIADSFTAALTRLTGQEQKYAKTAAFDLQLNPTHPGLQMHRLTSSRDPNFWSVRVNQDIRIIIHKTEASFMLAYVDHHDKAYAWAERRRIEAHPRTGAIQIVEVHELVQEARSLFGYAANQPAAETIGQTDHAIFAELTTEALLDIGVPQDWVVDVLSWSEPQFFEGAEHLPAESAEALLEYASTGQLPAPQQSTLDPFNHPDTLRRVQTIGSEEELRLALDFPWDKWSVFLHPSQRDVVNRDFMGPARVTGTAGTGKTIVALHRAARSVREDPQARVLLTSFSRPLANALRGKLAVLIGDDAATINRVSIASFEDAASELHQLATGRRPVLASLEVQQAALERAIAKLGYTELASRFVFSEWRHVVDAWNLTDLESYANVPRIGRKNRLGGKQREKLWPVMNETRQMLAARGLFTPSQLYSAVESSCMARDQKPFTHVVVDEAQDLGVAELRMMGALASGPNSLFFAGDLGQRIFQLPYSWSSLGVDVRGRSSSLRINYRTSRQIREAADRLLPAKVRDVDGVEDDRTGTQSVFEGPRPIIEECADEAREIEVVAAKLRTALSEGIRAGEIGIFVRSGEYLPRVRSAVAAAELDARQLTEQVGDLSDRVSIGTMHLAKGLEFKLAIVMACDDEALPLQSRVCEATDGEELDAIFETERHLFYVACTRARDHLHLSGVKPISDFVTDMGLAI